MPQRMDAFAFFNPTFVLGEIVDFLRGGDVQGIISGFTKEDPQHGLIGLLIFSQLAEQPLGENRVAVFFPFALFDPNHHTLNVDIAEFEMDQLSDPESRRVSGHQQTAISELDRDAKQSLYFSGA